MNQESDLRFSYDFKCNSKILEWLGKSGGTQIETGGHFLRDFLEYLNSSSTLLVWSGKPGVAGMKKVDFIKEKLLSGAPRGEQC